MIATSRIIERLQCHIVSEHNEIVLHASNAFLHTVAFVLYCLNAEWSAMRHAETMLKNAFNFIYQRLSLFIDQVTLFRLFCCCCCSNAFLSDAMINWKIFSIPIALCHAMKWDCFVLFFFFCCSFNHKNSTFEFEMIFMIEAQVQPRRDKKKIQEKNRRRQTKNIGNLIIPVINCKYNKYCK